MRRFFLIATLCFIPGIALAVFPDTTGHPHASYIEVLKDAGVVEGYPNGLFGPDLAINRAEFLKILMLAAYGDEALPTAAARCFTDFSGIEQWYWVYACEAKARGVVSGYPDGTFRGWARINLAEALKMINEAWNVPLTPPATGEIWYAPYTQEAERRGVYATFQRTPWHQMTRSDMAYLIVAYGEPIVGRTGADAVCGNGDQETGEQCDDGNRESGDGCSDICRDEGVVETTNPICGNAILETSEQCDDGNLENGDGCSDICIVVPEPIRHGALQVRQISVSRDEVAAGSKNVTFLAFETIPGRQDVNLTGLKLRLVAGSSPHLSNFRLRRVPSSGAAQQVGSASAAQGDRVSFSALNVPLAEGVAARFEVIADISANAPVGTVGLRFDTADAAFIEAIGAEDNRELTGITIDGGECDESICWIDVTIDDTDVPVGETGNLFVETVTIENRQLLAGETTPDLLKIRLTADGEPVSVERLRIAGYPESAFQLYVYREGSASPLGTLTGSACSPAQTGHACASLNLTLQPDEEQTLVIRASLKSDADGGVSGEEVEITLPADANTPGIEAVGIDSQADLTISDADSDAEGEIFIGRSSVGASSAIVGPQHDVVFAKIETIANNSPDSDGSPVLQGTQRLGQFLFTAAVNRNTASGRNDVVLDRLIFTVSAAGVTIDASSYTLFDPASAGASAPCSASGPTGTITVTCDNLAASAVSTAIGSGQSRSLRLQATVTNAGGNGAGITTFLNQLSNRSQPGTILWNDEVTDFDWADVPVDSVQSTRYEN